ncbi:MAG: helix-turn-helix domain-containing protein [Actinomycetes bacterium]
MDEASVETPITEKVVLTPLQVAQLTGLSRNTVYEEIASGRLPSVKVGKKKTKILVSRTVLDAWLAGTA